MNLNDMFMNLTAEQEKELEKKLKTTYIFEVRDGGCNQIGTECTHWVKTNEFASKKAVMERYNTKGYARKVRCVYTAWEIADKCGTKRLLQILKSASSF